MVLIAPGIARYSLNGTTFGQPWVNVLDFFIDTSGASEPRDVFVFDTAGNIINSWMEHMVAITDGATNLQSVSWVDLDSAGGSTGERTSTSLHTLPQSGTWAGDGNAPNLAVLITKVIVGGRGRRNGRIYMPGIIEEAVAGRSIESGQLPVHQAAFDAYLAELNDESSLPAGGTRDLNVVHTTSLDENGDPLPEPIFTGNTSVDRLQVNSILATQRRRLR